MINAAIGAGPRWPSPNSRRHHRGNRTLLAGTWGLTGTPGVADLVSCVGSVRSPAGLPSRVCSVKAFAADRQHWWSATPASVRPGLTRSARPDSRPAVGWCVGVASAVRGAAALAAGRGRVSAAASRQGGRPAGGLFAGLSPPCSGRHRQASAGADVAGDSCRRVAEAASFRCRAAMLEGDPPAATIGDHRRGLGLVRRHHPRLLDLSVGAAQQQIAACSFDVPPPEHLGRRRGRALAGNPGLDRPMATDSPDSAYASRGRGDGCFGGARLVECRPPSHRWPARPRWRS